jgi:uncharacterized protein DUF3800
MLIFIDESGDPGFKIDKGSTPVFVIAMVIFDDHLEAEKASLAIKELRRELKVNDKYEFKFNKTDGRFKNAFFHATCKYNFRVRATIVKKSIIYSSTLRNKKESFYNFIVMQILKQSKTIKHAKLRFDRRGEKLLRDEMRIYLSQQLDNKTNDVFTDLKFVDSKQNTLIQLADMVAGSIAWAHGGKSKIYLNKLERAGRIEDIWPFK